MRVFNWRKTFVYRENGGVTTDTIFVAVKGAGLFNDVCSYKLRCQDKTIAWSNLYISIESKGCCWQNLEIAM